MAQPESEPDNNIDYEQHQRLADLVVRRDIPYLTFEEGQRMRGSVENGPLIDVTVDALVRAGAVPTDGRADMLSYGRTLYPEFDKLPDDKYDELASRYAGSRLNQLFASWQRYTSEVTGGMLTPVARVERSRCFAAYMASLSVEVVTAMSGAAIKELPVANESEAEAI